MESTLGSSTALTFRGVVSWLALRSIGLSARTGPRTTTSGHSSSEASPKARGAAPLGAKVPDWVFVDASLRRVSLRTEGLRKRNPRSVVGGFVKRRHFPDGEASPDKKAPRLHGGPPPSMQIEIATRGARALVRSGIRSDGERSLPDAPVQLGAKAPCTEALASRGAAGWCLPAARIKGFMRGDSLAVLEVLDALTVVLADGLDCRNRSATFGSYAPR
jgi:hypothetical protein